MNCKNCGTQKELKPVQTCCEMTGTWITINMGYCPCNEKDDDDDDDLSGRMIDHGERPTITIDPKDASPGLLRKVQGLKNLQRVGRSIGIENTVNVEVKEINVSERIASGWFM
jgi:hypothetical protein